MSAPSIFVVDDDAGTVAALAAALERRFGPDYRVVTDGSPAAALARLGEACDRVTAAVADGAIAVRSVRDFLGAE